MGIDLSLRSAGAVVLGPRWDPAKPWGLHLHATRVGYELAEPTPEAKAKRLFDIAEGLYAFAWEHEVTDVFIEDYAFGLAGNSGIAIAEVGGAVKSFFFNGVWDGPTGCRLIVRPANISTVRKFLLGKLPKNSKVRTHQLLKDEMGCPFKTSDERDAFVVANYGRSELGLPGISLGTG